MDIQNSNGKHIQVSLPMNIAQEQYVFTDHYKSFDPNMCSAAEYSPPPPATNSNSQQTAVITPFHTIASNFNELPNQNSEIALVSASEVPSNCITYSNVIFVPTIANNENQLDQMGGTIELVKHESDVSGAGINDSQSFKYIVSSEPRFVNTFIRTNDIDNTATVLSNDSSGAFIGQPITNVPQIDESNLIVNSIPDEANQIHQHLNNVESIDQNQITVQMHTGNDQEVLMQDENGQLYRQVQNILINGASMCPSELLPILSAPVDLGDPDYVDNQLQSISRIQNSFNQRENSLHEIPFQIPVNFVSNSEPTETMPVTSKSIDTNLDMQQVEFIFNSYKNTHANQIDTNQYGTEQGILNSNTNYQQNTSMQSNNDSANQQRNLLESTMSTLLAAVNDITARDEQFQQYLNTSKSVPDHSLDYYSASQVENIPQSIYTSPTTKNPSECAKEMPKTFSLGPISNELFSNSCDSPINEFVDINDMEIIKKNVQSQQGRNVIVRRSRRRKTTKRKDDALLVVDKFVPSRALATLPTSYLYFENSLEANRSKQSVFAKREIPLDMKFGPFVGDTKTLNKHEIKMYRETNQNNPLLFLSHNSVLDVSNENTSNWMRFVRLATKHREQNLLLCVINSQLYFKCCKSIVAKQELRVGYSKEYAHKYHLNQLIAEKPEKPTEYLCIKCDERFCNNEQLKNHQNEHKTNNTKPPVQSVPRTTPIKNNDSTISPNKSKDRLNTGAIRMRKLALSKLSRTSGPTVRYACCYCSKVFSKFLNYKKHTNIVHSVDIEHKRVKVDAQHKRLTVEDSVMKKEPIKENESENIDAKQWFVCQTCQRHFVTAKKLEKHHLSNCSDKESMAVQCHICLKHLQTPSALSMHIKTHNSPSGICICPFCSQRYQSTIVFKEHVKSHMTNGTYKCPHCTKDFPKYSSVRKHIRINHSTVRFVCHECGKDFKSKYKLKEHSLSHSDVREFSCDDCDKQFKRKDKLREHILRIHAKKSFSRNSKKFKTNIKGESLETSRDEAPAEDYANDEDLLLTEEKDCTVQWSSKSMQSDDELPDVDSTEASSKPRFKPKVPPTDYERFIYKCQDCMLGFKRRGMLVNHMAKRHPEIRIDSIHELNLPILKTERCFYCQYCEKSYKSSSKRKAHILKYHPGQQLPVSTRYKNEESENALEQNPSFIANIGSITTHAHQCKWCYRQYASRSRLLQHKRKDHSKEIEDSYKHKQNDYFKDLNMIMDSHFQPSQMQINQSIDDYTMKFNEMHDNESHRFHHIGYEPENRLLELSSAALESFKDDYSFLSDSDVHTEAMEHSNIGGSRVDVNFKMVGDEFGQESSNCDLNSLPQLFEEIDCMSLKPSQFAPNSSTQIDGSIEKLSYNK
ncbi:uncharacterized protein LOC129568626 [Sitodiplosis mosellana]|uniref:uncharacterized protein LOC129568626 n=1 Tax=Sitodiplosis mosellana TaxID=263140 RepID=UPI0024438EEE|nr:uncharacterized protein LOC129568626 [Sitodiplosis mosellana]